ncbi:MAG: sugar phosphate isomerase/epimerase [Gemmatimonadetes bacterium]|nr:MAG: sugar phosphate isomerase/epimerase [Gemmatimonadota bacterium]
MELGVMIAVGYPPVPVEYQLERLAACEIFRTEIYFHQWSDVLERHIYDLLHQFGIQAVSIHCYDKPDFNLATFRESHRRHTLALLQQYLGIAERLHIPYVVVHPGRPLPALLHPLAYPALVGNLRRVEALLQHSTVKIAVENLPTGYVGADVAALVSLLDRLNSPRMGLCLDTGHAHLNGGVDQALDQMQSRLFTVHIHDNYGHRDEHLFPGQGTIGWQAVISKLQRIDFAGVFMLEIMDYLYRVPLEQALEDVLRVKAWLHVER